MPWFTQQSITKLNPIPHKKKDHTRSRGIHPKFTRMVQHMQTNQCDIPHKQKTTTTWSSQYVQEKHVTKFNIHS